MLIPKKTLKKINSLRREMVKLNDESLKSKTNEFKERLKNGETLDSLLPEAFAVVREASRRVLNMEHFDVQIIGGIVLHEGKIAEMKTGEGKTLVAALPSYLNALTGNGVHVVTVNDYLAKRDADEIGQIHKFLGLTVGCILADMSREERRAQYECDITYVTNSEVGFDYLRDNMVQSADERVQRSLSYCIIDEIDSILIDEAQTPLIISGKGETPTDLYLKADMIAKQLKKGKRTESDKWSDAAPMETGDYIVDTKEKTVYLTAAGIKIVERLFGIRNLMDESNSTLNHLIQMALRANSLFQRDKDYVVSEDEVLIVDPFTGRTLAGRRFSDGLHQAIEAKEGCSIKTETLSMATITYQHFFNKYMKKCGMTGTAMTEKTELGAIYNLKVVEVPTNKPVIRVDDTDLVYMTKEEKYHEICQRIKNIHATGQPILVGTASIDVSELLSERLQQMQISHNVLNAKYHEREAEIIALAGVKNAVTIATNMAGRGTDIKLDEGARAAGGLYVIGTERHESRRIDNQLRGRSGRQGDPGHSVFMISLEDDIMKDYGSANYIETLKKAGLDLYEPISSKMLSKQITNAQQRVEGNNFSLRKMLLDFDSVNDEQRELFYAERNRIIDGEDPKDMVLRMAKRTLDSIHEECGDDSDLFNEKIFTLIRLQMTSDFKTNEEKVKFLGDVLPAMYENFSKSLPSPDIMPLFVRNMLLKTMDRRWITHIDGLEHLRQGIGLRAYGQHDPKVEYKLAAYDMFEEMLSLISQDICIALFRPVLPFRRT